MESGRQRRFLTLWPTLNPQTAPRSRDEILGRMAASLQQVLENARILFYLRASPPGLKSHQLLPCPARPLAPGVFVYEASPCKSFFTFETSYSHCLPLKLNGYDFGHLFLESKTLTFDQSALLLLDLLARQVARDFYELRPLIDTVRLDPPEASVPLKIDRVHRRVWIAGRPLYLSKKEFMLLEALERQHEQGEPCSYELLYQTIYADAPLLPGERDTRLYNLAKRLKRKLERIEGQPVEIETIRGVGYQLRF